MTINTRMKSREPVPSSVQLIISDATAQNIKLNIQRSKDNNAVNIAAKLIDISAVGIGVEAPYMIPAGVEMEARIDMVPFSAETGIERKDPLSAKVRVASCIMKLAHIYRLGLAFIGISAQDKAFIEDFIKHRERRKNPRIDMSK